MKSAGSKDASLPLEGLRVTGLCDGAAQSAHFTLDILRDLGASVQRLSTVDSHMNDVLQEIESSDILIVDDDARRLLASRELGPAVLQRRFPWLVVAYFSPFGLVGPWSNLRGSEIVVEAAAAVMLSNGEEGDPPLSTGIPVSSLGGALLGTIALLAAVHERHSSGTGQYVDQSEYDSVFAFSGTLLPSVFLTGQPLKRLGNRHAMASPWNVYPTRDAWLVLCTMNDAQFETLARAIQRPELIEDDRFTTTTLRVANAVVLDEFIREWSRTMLAEDASSYLQSVGLSAEAVKSVPDVIRDPQTAFRDLVRYDHDRRVAGPFLKFSTPRSLSELVLSESSPASGEAAEACGPLNGVKVVEFAAHTAGPLATRFLSLLGAEVIKVESPKGESARYIAQQVEGSSYLFLINNTDKSDCTIDLQSDVGSRQMKQLVADADIFLTNFVPSTLATLRMSPSDLLEVNPRLLYCGITGFGEGGPYGGRRIFDMSVQAMTGIMDLTGLPVNEPRKSAISIVDVFGACSAAIGALAGLISRDRGGGGRVVEASLYDIAVWSTQNEWNVSAPDTSEPGSCITSECLPTSDGFLAVTVDRDTLIEAAQRLSRTNYPDAEGDLLRRIDSVRHGEGLGRLTELFSSAQWESECWSSGIAAFVPRQLDEAVEAEHTKTRRLLVDVEFKGHVVRVIGSPFKFSRSAAEVRRAAPSLGQDNERLLDNTYSLEI